MRPENRINKWVARIKLAAGIICLAASGAILYSQPVNGSLLSVIAALKRKPPQPTWEGTLHSIGVALAIVGLLLTGLLLWIKLCNGDKDPELKGFAVQAELQDHYYKLTAAEILQITGMYKLDYLLGLANANLPFERVYNDSTYAVFKLP